MDIKQFIKENGMTMESVNIPARTDCAADNFESLNHYLCTFKCDDRVYQIPFSVGDYYVFEAGKKGYYAGRDADIVKKLSVMNTGKTVAERGHYHAIIDRGRKVFKPAIEDVLDCIGSDMSGFYNSRCFEEWASEYGYDTDSRQAEKIYTQVRDQTLQFENLIGRNACEQLAFEVEKL